ncbi:hypothetical protein [Geomicrobium sp. JCM 19037]|nr:hypothetical protein [Geomicrobium sp. JCM 19037]
MRKKIGLACAASVLLVSCSGEERTQDTLQIACGMRMPMMR